MKFWELESVLRSEKSLLEQLLREPRWHQYAEWHAQFAQLVNGQDRSILDAEVPLELCMAALTLSPARYEVRDGWLRRAPAGGARGSLSAVQAFDRSGGSALEEVEERGSLRVDERSCDPT